MEIQDGSVLWVTGELNYENTFQSPLPHLKTPEVYGYPMW